MMYQKQINSLWLKAIRIFLTCMLGIILAALASTKLIPVNVEIPTGVLSLLVFLFGAKQIFAQTTWEKKYVRFRREVYLIEKTTRMALGRCYWKNTTKNATGEKIHDKFWPGIVKMYVDLFNDEHELGRAWNKITEMIEDNHNAGR